MQATGRFTQYKAQLHHPVQLQCIVVQLSRKTHFRAHLPNEHLFWGNRFSFFLLQLEILSRSMDTVSIVICRFNVDSQQCFSHTGHSYKTDPVSDKRIFNNGLKEATTGNSHNKEQTHNQPIHNFLHEFSPSKSANRFPSSTFGVFSFCPERFVFFMPAFFCGVPAETDSEVNF